MIQGNLIGFGMLIFSAIFVLIGALVLKLPDWIVMITAGVVLIITDLIYRFYQKNNAQKDEKSWIYKQEFGGSLYYIPTWIFGIVVIIINLIAHFTKS